MPEQISGNYWITDYENGKKINLINIEATENGWNLISNHDAFVVDNNDIMIPYTILKEYSFYLLKNNYRNEKYYLYCSPVYDTSYKELGINSKITVGKEQCDICYKLGGIPKKAFSIEKRDNYYYIDILSEQASVYVNQTRTLKTKRLEYGDIIFTFGLKIILFRREGSDYLLVNNPGNLLDFNASFVNVVPTKCEFVEDNAEIVENTLYEENYFYRAPHFYKSIKKFDLTIESPPTKKDEESTPMLLTIGPMVTMAMTSVITLLTTLEGVASGEKTLKSSIPSIVMCASMLLSSLLWPILTKAYQKFSKKMYERKRQRLYKKYLDKKEEEINNELGVQRWTLLDNHFSVTDCQNVIRGHNVKLWQRRITDEDFLTLPVGVGNKNMEIEVTYPEEKFSLTEDNLLEMAYELGKKPRILTDVPITFSFYDNKVTGVVGDPLMNKEFIDRLVLQIMANYSYDEIKIATFTSIDNETSWDYMKVLPHSWSNDKTIRYFGSSNEDYREMIYALEKIYNQRKQSEKKEERFAPHYVIITDAIKSIDNYDFIKEIMVNPDNLGFSIILLVDQIAALPNECKSFINISNNTCTIFSSVLNSETQEFKLDLSSIDEIYNCAKELANINVNIKNEQEASLPDMYQFLEMFQVGKVEQLNSKERWKKSNPIVTLQAPIGIGKSGEVIMLDLHEKSHGPHGLIAGTTGSGKSEFIITYILSLAVNYHPYEVQIILIDYKGGSLAGAFSNDNYVLPHVAGTITNLDGNELNRSLASIESEIKRRQREFNNAKKISNESTIDIYKYQKLWRDGRLENMEPIAHLFIISDEFAELKEQQPEFMDKLISVARVGRSLGIHLILATQKPGGVVDSQIWSNTRFRVCLKVQDVGDSQEVLKKADAAYLKKTGRFYLQVGYDEVFTLGQSAWAGGQYYPNAVFKKDVDTSVNAINNIGAVTLSEDVEIVEVKESLGEELSNVVKYLSNIAMEENIKIRKLWLDKIPERIYIDAVKKKYNFTRKPFQLEPIIGEYDDPMSQQQYALTVPITKHGNAIIYGIAGSGKEQFLTSLIYSCMTSYSPEEVNFYIIDLGAETLKIFAESPYVGDVAFVSDTDKIRNLFKMISVELDSRRELFSNYGGNYRNYIESQAESKPSIIIMINNYDVFTENYSELMEELEQLTRDSFKYGIYFVLTVSSSASIRLKFRKNFALAYGLQQNSDMEFFDIFGNCRGKIPPKFKGRGLFKREEVYEFQTAYVKEENETQYIQEFCKMVREKTTYRAKKIPVLPKVVDYDAIKSELSDTPNMIIGINKNTLTPEKYNFRKNSIDIIASSEIENTTSFVQCLINQVAYTNQYEILFMNATEQTISNKNLENRIYTSNFNDVLNQIFGYIESVYKIYEQNGFNDSVLLNQKKFMIYIYGIYDFMNKLNSEVKGRLGEVMKLMNQIKLVTFVIVDSADMIKNFTYDGWFKEGCDLAQGIWIGNGIAENSLFRVTRFGREDREEISNEYGFVIQNSKVYKVKMLSSFEVPEEEIKG